MVRVNEPVYAGEPLGGIKVLNPRAIPYKNNILRCSAAELLIRYF
jgi:hypothetical protein